MHDFERKTIAGCSGRKPGVDTGIVEYEDLGVCNCANCGLEVLGERTQELLRHNVVRDNVKPPPPVAGRINGRPYCGECHAKLSAEYVPSENYGRRLTRPLADRDAAHDAPELD